MGQAEEHLLKSLKQTAGSRFIAAKRLERHDRGLTRLTAFASAYVIGLTVLPYFLKLAQTVTDIFNFVTVVLALIILVSSLMQYSSAEIVTAEQQHRSGLEINEILRELRLKQGNATEQELLDFTKRYNAALQKYSVNHDQVDFLKYQLEHPEESPWLKWYAKIAIRFRVAVGRYSPTLLLMIVSVFVVGLAIYGIWPYLKASLP